jgi:hypothetical protein
MVDISYIITQILCVYTIPEIHLFCMRYRTHIHPQLLSNFRHCRNNHNNILNFCQAGGPHLFNLSLLCIYRTMARLASMGKTPKRRSRGDAGV